MNTTRDRLQQLLDSAESELCRLRRSSDRVLTEKIINDAHAEIELQRAIIANAIHEQLAAEEKLPCADARVNKLRALLVVEINKRAIEQFKELRAKLTELKLKSSVGLTELDATSRIEL